MNILSFVVAAPVIRMERWSYRLWTLAAVFSLRSEHLRPVADDWRSYWPCSGIHTDLSAIDPGIVSGRLLRSFSVDWVWVGGFRRAALAGWNYAQQRRPFSPTGFRKTCGNRQADGSIFNYLIFCLVQHVCDWKMSWKLFLFLFLSSHRWCSRPLVLQSANYDFGIKVGRVGENLSNAVYSVLTTSWVWLSLFHSYHIDELTSNFDNISQLIFNSYNWRTENSYFICILFTFFTRIQQL
jgi:hypothetical protein